MIYIGYRHFKPFFAIGIAKEDVKKLRARELFLLADLAAHSGHSEYVRVSYRNVGKYTHYTYRGITVPMERAFQRHRAKLVKLGFITPTGTRGVYYITCESLQRFEGAEAQALFDNGEE